MMMVRATVVAVGLVSASSFEIVSQTFKGNLTMKYSTPVPSPTIAMVELGLDMEAVRGYMNEYIVIEMPKYNITSTTKQIMIFDAATKRATMYTDTHVESPQPMPKTPATCKYFEFANLPDAASVGKCMQDVAALAKPEAPEDGLQKFSMHMPVPAAQGDVDEFVYTDKDFVMKKLVADITVTGAHPMTIHEEMTDMNSKAGAPDSSVFVVPASWGTCEKQALPPMPQTSNPVVKSFLHCMGMASKALTATALPDCSKTACPAKCQCGTQKCPSQIEACLADKSCAAGEECANACPCGSMACLAACAAKHPTAKGFAVLSCVQTACPGTETVVV